MSRDLFVTYSTVRTIEAAGAFWTANQQWTGKGPGAAFCFIKHSAAEGAGFANKKR